MTGARNPPGKCPYCGTDPESLPRHLREQCDDIPEMDSERVY